MSGVAVVAAVWVGYLAGHLFGDVSFSASGLLVLGLMTALGAVGFVDDFIKLRRRRRLGLNKTAKLLGQLVTAVVFALLAVRFPNAEGLRPMSTNLSFMRDIAAISFSGVGFVVFCYLVVALWSNAVTGSVGSRRARRRRG